MTVAGDTVESGEQAVTLPQNGSALVNTLDIADQLQQHGARNLLVWFSLAVDGEIVSENLETFSRPKHLPLSSPRIETSVQQISDGVYAVTLQADVPAVYVWLELPGAQFNDNFLHLRPNTPKTIHVTTNDIDQLAVRSLYDTYQ